MFTPLDTRWDRPDALVVLVSRALNVLDSRKRPNIVSVGFEAATKTFKPAAKWEEQAEAATRRKTFTLKRRRPGTAM